MKFSKKPIALAAITLLAGAPLAAQAVSVNFKAPSSGATLNNVTWNNTSACEVSGSGIARTQFVLINSSGNVTNLNSDSSSPFRCNLVSSNYSNGNYTLRVYAYDSAGNRASSSRQITIKNGTVTDAAPKVSISAPANNATISTSTTCRATASDDKGVRQVQFFVDGKAISTDTSSSYTCTLNNKLYTNGAHTLMARVTDSSGKTADSAPITFNVTGGIASGGGGTQNNPPILSITAPAAGSTLAGTSVAFSATATDTTGTVAKVELYLVSGTTQKLVATDTSAPYSGTFSTTGVANGPATLMAVATDSLGATSTVQRSVTIDNTVVSNPGGDTGGGSAGAIDPAHIISKASADTPFSSQAGYSGQALGSSKSATSIPESGINGTVLSSGETLRLGKTVDPVNSLQKALAFQVATSDPLTSGGKRSELSMAKNIEMDKWYWIAVSAFVHDWGTLSTSDDALFALQLHAGGGDGNLGGPAFGIYTTQNGRTFRVQAKYSTSATPSDGNSTSLKFAEYPMPFGRWADFVVKFKENTSGNGFLQVWMDGQLIASHQGSLGYNTGVNDYAKFGYYNWSGSAMSSTPRKVLLRSPTVVADPTGSTYSQDQLRALLGSSAASVASGSTSSTGGTTQTADSGVCSTASCVLNQ